MFNFNLQSPIYTFGFGGKYPDFRKRGRVARPYSPVKRSLPVTPQPTSFPKEPTMAIFPHPVAPSYIPNQTPSDIFQQYKPREATGMEQMRGKEGYRGLPYGFMGGYSNQYQPRFIGR